MPFEPGEHPILSRRRPPAFRPSFTLALLYLAVFFFVFAFLLVMPELVGVLRDVPPGPEQQAIAERAVREVAGPRTLWALLLALAALGFGSYLRVLPGMKRD